MINPKADKENPDFFMLADYRARCFVNGSKRHEKTGKIEPIAGAWSEAFRDHPYVIEAEYQGWGRELRGAVVSAVKSRIYANKGFGDIDTLMPDRKWVDYAKQQAERARKAQQWRDETYGPPGNTEEIVAGLRRRFEKGSTA